ncbi:hypothetical protein COL5a_008861 [Colletotrichum fioriniae]|nr:hypothetical protein COL5a_008861 [Colletotrichum fioriniae]
MSASPAEESDAWKAQDKGPTIVIVCWVVTAISTSFVIGRVYVRGKIMKKFQSDDWFIVLGQFCGYISTALSTIAVTYDDTVEGSTIIIASSIPVMQPLLELILRRNPFSSAKDSKQTPQYYEDYSSHSKSRSRGGGGIELGQRKPKVKPKDELGLTIVEGDSQENILTPTSDTNQDMFASSEAPTLISVQNDANQRPADGKIMRTDLVSITYEEQGPAHDTSASSRWKAI